MVTDPMFQNQDSMKNGCAVISLLLVQAFLSKPENQTVTEVVRHAISCTEEVLAAMNAVGRTLDVFDETLLTYVPNILFHGMYVCKMLDDDCSRFDEFLRTIMDMSKCGISIFFQGHYMTALKNENHFYFVEPLPSPSRPGQSLIMVSNDVDSFKITLKFHMLHERWKGSMMNTRLVAYVYT